jgi:hypothetical protein
LPSRYRPWFESAVTNGDANAASDADGDANASGASDADATALP